MINDQSGQVKLDYYVDDHMELPGLTSLTGKDRTIEFSAVSNEDEIEEKTESVKLTSVSHEDVKRVLALARKVGLVPRLGSSDEEEGHTPQEAEVGSGTRAGHTNGSIADDAAAAGERAGAEDNDQNRSSVAEVDQP